ncbi:hypothetical protein FDP41_000082 [Naegleria fowleri]|uniref:Endonuclease n=1 Tax=Naegleria fowleri TaxID=5763 RepID=A0A6A5C3R3_NAEFO|nr:uncharacterized protein FDP41_000082 [Naegleria fowleri]KAF0985043.1 hypothetical protein FDP41_000082 [Naegleria fowleri]
MFLKSFSKLAACALIGSCATGLYNNKSSSLLMNTNQQTTATTEENEWKSSVVDFRSKLVLASSSSVHPSTPTSPAAVIAAQQVQEGGGLMKPSKDQDDATILDEKGVPPTETTGRPAPPPVSGRSQPSPTTPSSQLPKIPGYVKTHSKTRESLELFQAFYELGLPQDREMHLFSGYFSATDTRLRIPSFVAWMIKGASSSEQGGKERKSDRSNSKFLTSPFLPPEFNADNTDYSVSGYDRGHMCPCGDFYYSMDQKALDETFYLSHNVVPQEPNNNRFYWLRVEMFTRSLAKQFDNVYVVAGPLFVPEEANSKKFVKYEVIGDNHVAVPTHLYRILVGEKKGENKFFIQAFMLPNKPIPKTKPITDFIVPVSEIEKHSGMKLLHRIDKAKTAPLCKNFNCELKPWQELEIQKILWDKEITKEKAEQEWNKLLKEGWQPSPQIVQQYQAKLSKL